MTGERLPRFAAGPVALVVVAQAVVLTALSGQYGFHRDELYFVVSGQHPAWGYVDQPPLTPWLARAATTLFGDSPAGLRVAATLLGAVIVVLVALIAREFGGGRPAQVFSAVATALSAYVLVITHMLATNTADLVCWLLVVFFALRLLRTGDGRWWLGIGAATGLGLLNKWLIPLLLLGLLAGVLATGPRQVLRSWWLAAGIGVAAVLAAPVVVWEAAHGFPLLSVAAGISSDSGGQNRLLFVPMQIVYLSPVLVPVWIAGFLRPWREPDLRWARAVTLAYPLVAVILLVVGGKPYYGVPLLFPFLAAGAPLALGWFRRGGAPGQVLTGVVAAVCVVISVVVSLPVVPTSALNGVVLAMNKEQGEEVGWPDLAATVARAWAQVPAAERAGAVVLTSNYGQAGAVERYGGPLGLPRPYSPHMSYGDWGPPPDERRGPVVLVGKYFHTAFWQAVPGCRVVAVVHNAQGVHNDEDGAPVRICDTPAVPWSVLWPRIRAYA